MRSAITVPALMLVVALATTPANAQGCRDYMDQSVKTVSFGELRASLPKVAAKSEFETADQFSQRITAANALKVSIIEKPGVAGAIYNAEKSEFGLSKTTMFATGIGRIDAVGNLDPKDFLGPNHSSDTMMMTIFAEFFPISSAYSQVGTYVGGSAFGAKATIKKYAENLSLIATRQDMPWDLTTVAPMEVSAAKVAKAGLRVAYVVQPQYPFFTQLKAESPATLDDLRDVTTTMDIVSARVSCALIYKNTDKKVIGYVDLQSKSK